MKTTSQIIYQGNISQEPEINEIYQFNLDQVCIYLERSELLLWSIWVCFKKNIAYLLIDQSIPIERLSYMIAETGIETCITSSQYKDKLPGIKQYILVDSYSDINKLSGYYGKSEDAYTVFTSGTTGMPKGIHIRKKSVFSFIENFTRAMGFKPNDRILCSTSVNFDIFFVESVLALYVGMDIIVANEIERTSPRQLGEILQHENVDILQITPSRIHGLITYDAELKSFSKLKKILVGGEIFPTNLLGKLQQNTKANIYNLYGPAEATIWASIADLTREKKVHIGKPIPSYKMYIVDKNLNLIMNGAIGQIAIGLPDLARGYINQPELSKEKFVKINSIGETVYLTGDIAKVQEDGNFYYLGRLDRQVKIRGNRVELEEIECVLQSIEGINQVLVSNEDTSHGNKLVAFCNLQDTLTFDKIKEELRKRLPEYMIPQEFVFVDNFPVTTNGKIACSEVVEAYHRKTKVSSTQIECSNDIEREIINHILIIVEQNTKDIITTETSLDELGIDSLLYIDLVVALEEKYNIVFDDEYVINGSFENVGQIANYVMHKIEKNEIYM